MKLLLDQNLSPHLVDAPQNLYPTSTHVRDVGLASADDEVVWTFAAEQGLSIVSKDSDFRQRSFVRGHPPKVVWIARGDCSTDATLHVQAVGVPELRGIGTVCVDREGI